MNPTDKTTAYRIPTPMMEWCPTGNATEACNVPGGMLVRSFSTNKTEHADFGLLTVQVVYSAPCFVPGAEVVGTGEGYEVERS